MFRIFQSNDVLAPLAPLNQVSQLLQSRKSEQDVQTICDLCTSLSTAQVLKVMKSYKLDDYESEITNVFLEKLTKELNARQMVCLRDILNLSSPNSAILSYSKRAIATNLPSTRSSFNPSRWSSGTATSSWRILICRHILTWMSFSQRYERCGIAQCRSKTLPFMMT